MATGVSPSSTNRRGEERNDDHLQESIENRSQENTEQLQRVGYDCEFVKPPPIEFPQTDCPVCLLILREPCQVDCCGYGYCEACIQRVQNDKKPCPSCQNAGFVIFPDKRLKRSLYALSVYCCQRETGCEWVGELGELDKHLNLQPLPEKLLNGCQFSKVDCTYCAQPLQRCYVQAHQSNDCPKRPYTCQHCNQHVSTFEEVTQNHWPVCSFFPLSCPNKCELVLQRQELKDHVKSDCPLTFVKCYFYIVGCQTQLVRRDLSTHVRGDLTQHIFLLQEHMMAHPEEKMATYVWLMVSSIQAIYVDNVTIHSKLSEAKQVLQQSRYELREALDQLQKSRGRVSQLLTTVASQHEMLNAQSKALEVNLSQMEEYQKKSTLTHKDLNDKVQQTSNLLKTTVSAHMETSAFEHILDQCKRENDAQLREAKEKLLKNLTTSEHEMRTKLNSLQGTITQQKHKLTEKLSVCEKKLQATLATQQTTITKSKIENLRLQQSITDQVKKQRFFEAKLEAKLVTGDKDITSMITASEKKVQALKDTLCHHQQSLEKVMCTGSLPFEFTMTEFEQHKRANDIWHSPAFYTHTHGYKMCISVYANGCGTGKGTHLSVYVHLMKSDFDDDLQWPCKGKIIFQLLNQLEDSEHHTRTVNFSKTADPSAISRVTSGVKAQSGWGKPTFIAHNQLNSDSHGKHQYVKNNQLKFKVFKAIDFDFPSRIHYRCLTLECLAKTVELQVCAAPIKFTLPDFEKQKNEDSVWHSLPFYTHRCGYRMCLEVYPNGIFGAHGTHVSIFTCIMRGPFDTHLKWPFQGEIMIKVVNQLEDKNHHTRIIEYTDHTPYDNACRVTEKERGGSWGNRLFIPHTLLGYNAARKTQYLQRDSLQIHISKISAKK